MDTKKNIKLNGRKYCEDSSCLSNQEEDYICKSTKKSKKILRQTPPPPTRKFRSQFQRRGGKYSFSEFSIVQPKMLKGRLSNKLKAWNHFESSCSHIFENEPLGTDSYLWIDGGVVLDTIGSPPASATMEHYTNIYSGTPYFV